MITDILILYWAFSALFMIGYINTEDESVTNILVIRIIGLIIAPIIFPVALGIYISKNS